MIPPQKEAQPTQSQLGTMDRHQWIVKDVVHTNSRSGAAGLRFGILTHRWPTMRSIKDV